MQSWTIPLISIAVVGTASVAFARLYRPWALRWGATDSEVVGALQGDDVVARPAFDATRAITIDAAPEAVWLWIAQIGFGRAGWYSYDLLDNFGRHSSETVMPSLQDVHVGDLVPMGPGDASGLWVKDVQPDQWMLWWDGVGHTTWLWNLEEVEPGRTRLVTRVRSAYQWTHPSILFSLLLIEPFDFPMMRKCLTGIKRRAEAAEQARPSSLLASKIPVVT